MFHLPDAPIAGISLTPSRSRHRDRSGRFIRQVPAAAIAAARQQAIREYRLALIDLHQRLLPHLDPAQRKQIEESCAKLKSSLDNADGSGK